MVSVKNFAEVTSMDAQSLSCQNQVSQRIADPAASA
jgi:hypothetical protein